MMFIKIHALVSRALLLNPLNIGMIILFFLFWNNNMFIDGEKWPWFMLVTLLLGCQTTFDIFRCFFIYKIPLSGNTEVTIVLVLLALGSGGLLMCLFGILQKPDVFSGYHQELKIPMIRFLINSLFNSILGLIMFYLVKKDIDSYLNMINPYK
jgi:hypothetical protein